MASLNCVMLSWKGVQGMLSSFSSNSSVQYANLFSDNVQTMRQIFSQADCGAILGFVLSCLTLLDV